MTAPVVLSLATAIFNTPPAAVLTGDTLWIEGSHFSTATDVTINGLSVTFTINSDSEIQLTVPTGATSGVVVVTNPDGTSNPTPRSSRDVVICQPGPWQTLPDSYWTPNFTYGHGTTVGDLRLTNAATSADVGTVADAWTRPGAATNSSPPSGITGTGAYTPISGSEHSPDTTGTPGGSPEGAQAFENFIRIDYTNAIANAFLSEADVERIGGVTMPAGALALRYENGDGHLTVVPHGGQQVVYQAAVNHPLNSWILARLSAGQYEADADFDANWFTPGSYPTAVATIAATSAMTTGPVDVTVTDSGDMDASNQVAYAVLPVATDGSDLDLTIDDQNLFALLPLRGGPLMSAPRYRWIYPASAATPPLRQRQRHTGLGAAYGPPLRQRGTTGDEHPPLRQRRTL